jgi:hypothetical protein
MKPLSLLLSFACALVSCAPVDVDGEGEGEGETAEGEGEAAEGEGEGECGPDTPQSVAIACMPATIAANERFAVELHTRDEFPECWVYTAECPAFEIDVDAREVVLGSICGAYDETCTNTESAPSCDIDGLAEGTWTFVIENRSFPITIPRTADASERCVGEGN